MNTIEQRLDKLEVAMRQHYHHLQNLPDGSGAPVSLAVLPGGDSLGQVNPNGESAADAAIDRLRAELTAMTERAETAEAHIDEVCEVMKERDKLRAELAAMTERAEAGYAAIAKLSSAIGNPCVSSDVSLEMGVVDEAIRRQANAIAERDAALALLREAQFVLDYYGESDISCRIDNLVAGAQP